MLNRRAFLRLGFAGAAAASQAPRFLRDPAFAEPAPGAFGYGIASGDPMHDRMILWTRITPSVDATPGSGLGAPADADWEVATDPAFRRVVAHGTASTSAADDHTVKVDADGLDPLTDYWYRFTALGETSPVGRARTLPAPGADVASVRMGVVSCSNWEGGYFAAYRHLADREDLDLILHLGDYVYEYGVGGYGPGSGFGRVHDPAVEMTTLEHYRRRHALYKTDPDLRRLHERYAFVTMIDDHEVADNAWAEGAVNHSAGEGDYIARRAAAFQAYFEWMPIRPPAGGGIYRRLGFGALADLFLLDERTYRSQQVQGVSGDVLVTDPAVADPGRTMLGTAQRDWLTSGLDASTARWKVLGNGVMFAPLVIASVPDVEPLKTVLQGVFTAAGIAPPVVLNGDQWDGYQAEQAAFRGRFGDVGGVVILTGDIHSSWAAEIPADPATYLPGVGGDTTAVEFVTPAVTADSFRAALEDAGLPLADQLAPQVPLLVSTGMPWFKYLDPDRQGFGVFDLTAGHAQYDWFYVSDRTDPNATLVDGPSWRTPAGTNKLEAATRLGARPAAPAGGPATAAPGASSPDVPATAPTGIDTGTIAMTAAGLGAVAAAGIAATRRAATG